MNQPAQQSAAIVAGHSTVIFHFDIKLSDGSAAESTRVHNKPAKLQLGSGAVTAEFEAQLAGLCQGDSKTFTLPPEHAYGMPNPDNIYYLDRSKFSLDAPAQAGMIIGFAMPDGSEMPGLVREVVGDSVTVDFNHPLAGQTLTFSVEIIEVVN